MPRGVTMAVELSGFHDTVNSIRELKARYGGEGESIVGVGAEYGVYLELGTSRMPPYPFFYPAARWVITHEWPDIEAQAIRQPNPTQYAVHQIAERIERKAKEYATGGPPGQEHPQVQTGFLKSSIRFIHLK